MSEGARPPGARPPGGPDRRPPASVTVLAVALLAVHAALLAGALGPLPGWARVGLAFAVVVGSPGAALVTLGARPATGAWTLPGWAFVLGLAWNSVLLMVPMVTGGSFLGLAGWSLALDAALWTVALARPRSEAAPAPPLARGAQVAIALAALLGCVTVALLGPHVGHLTDTPEHLATLRHMLDTGETVPSTAFLSPDSGLGQDPRKGLWTAQVALVLRLAGESPIEGWRWIGVLVLPLLVTFTAALGALAAGSAGAAVAAWGLVLMAGGGMAQGTLRQIAVSSRLADHLVLATVVAALSDLRSPRRAARVVAAAGAVAAVTASVGAAFELAVALGALLVGVLIRDRRASPEFRRLLVTTTLAGLAALPYVLLRTIHLEPTTNAIHIESQGLLLLPGGLRIVSPGLLWAQMGIAWVLVPLAWPWLWRAGRGNTAVLHLLTASLGAGLIVYDPLVVGPLESRMGYLLWRVLWIVPFASFLGWLLPALVQAVRSERAPGRRALSVAVLAAAVALLTPGITDAVAVLRDHRTILAEERREDPRRFADAFAWMDAHLAPGSVVLADPATSYVLPVLTRLRVTHVVDQHSSPLDARALQRILDARDALDPWGGWPRTVQVIREAGVRAIALNGRFDEPPPFDLWAPSREWFAASRARFDRHPDAFVRVFDRDDFVVYEVRPAALDALAEPAVPRPFVAPWPPGGRPVLASPEPGLPALVDLTLVPSGAAPGGRVRAVLRWHAATPAPPASYKVAIRCDRDLPDGWRPPAAIGKPVRKLLERAHGRLYRFRDDHLPVGGQYGVDLWTPDEIVSDSVWIEIPPAAAPGRWRVEVRMLRQPHYANLRLSDYLSDRDLYSGVPAGTLEVVAPDAPAAAASGGGVRR